MDEEAAAVKLQSVMRGNSARLEFKDVRDEEARRQWVEYYVAMGQYDEARERIYGMPYDEWKARYQVPATAEQQAAFDASGKSR